MPATLMVHLTPGADAASLLQLAGDVVGRLKARGIVGISGMRPLQLYAGPEAYVPSDLFEQDIASIEKEFAKAESAFRAAFAGGSVAVEWRSAIVPNLVSDYIAEQMRSADLLITSPTAHGLVFDAERYLEVGDLVLTAGRPVLIAGAAVTKLDLGHVMVAWKDSREARRAVVDALPLLRLAGNVTVVEVADADEVSQAQDRTADVVEWLEGHGIAATARAERGGDEDSVVLSGLLEDLNAGLLVAGAYGHTRLREWVLGGVTRDLLLHPARCSFLSH